MKTQTYLFFTVAILAVFLVSTVSAAEIAQNGLTVSFKDVQLTGSNNIVGYVGETVPVRVVFTSAVDVTDARIRVRIEGHRDEVATSTKRLNLVAGGTYTELLNLKLPSDLRSTEQDYTLYVEVSSATDRTEATYNIQMQRESYELRVLSVDYDLDVNAGSVAPVMIVVKNTGYNKNDDIYVTVSIPEIGISTRAYLEDLVAVDSCDDFFFGICDRRDSVSKSLNLRIPENTAPGIYDMTVTVHNADTRTVEKRVLKVNAPTTSSFIATQRNQDIRTGETKTYDLVIVNSGDTIKVYTLSAVSSSALSVSVPSTVTVAPQTAYTVPVSVRAENSAEIGSYTFAVSVNGQQTSFVANVIGSSSSYGVVALTVILAIIFVALLVLLIVLLFKRERKIEEVETSYY